MKAAKEHKPQQSRVIQKGKTILQLFEIGPPNFRSVTLIGQNGTCTFEECTYNSVKYECGENRCFGSETKNPAKWAGWIKNANGNRNATQMHVVNCRWGGSGEQDGKNLVPGSPSNNSHHYHDAEVIFDNYCFGGAHNNQALHDCLYECRVTPSYGQTINIQNSQVSFDDPKVEVRITDLKANKYIQDYSPIRDGVGILIRDGSI